MWLNTLLLALRAIRRNLLAYCARDTEAMVELVRYFERVWRVSPAAGARALRSAPRSHPPSSPRSGANVHRA